MRLQRIVMPDGKITWTPYDGDAIVDDVREFVIYLEAQHYALSRERRVVGPLHL